jgi:hypothetical protein
MTTAKHMAEGWWPDSKGVLVPTPDWGKVGMLVYEGLTVMGLYLMGSLRGGLADRGARGEKIGQDSPIMIKDEGGELFGGNPLAHYGVAQRAMLDCIQRSKAFPGVVLWTAHESKGEDKESSEKIIGPGVVGSAMTAKLPQLFAHTLHFAVADGAGPKAKDTFTGKSVTSATQIQHRIYTRDHYDPDGLTFTKFKAVTRCPLPGKLPDYFVAPPEDPGRAIRDFYRTLKQLKGEFAQKDIDHS